MGNYESKLIHHGYKLMLEKSEGAIQNEYSRDTGNIGHTGHR